MQHQPNNIVVTNNNNINNVGDAERRTLNEHKNKRNHCNKNETGKRSEETKVEQREAHAFSSIVSTSFVKIMYIYFFLLLFLYHCDAIMCELNLMNGVRLSLSDMK